MIEVKDRHPYYLKNQEHIKIKSREWRVNNKERRNEASRRWARNHPEQALLNYAKRRARIRNIEFDLQLEDIQIPEFCPVLGIPLFQGDRMNPNSPSLDRINPLRGYIKHNVAVISLRANNLKKDASLEEIRRLLLWMEQKLGV